MRKIVDLLLILGTASLIYYKRITEETGTTVTIESIGYRSDFVFLLAVLLAIVAGISGVLGRKRIVRTQTEGIVFGAIASYLMFSVTATMLSIITYNLGFDLKGFTNLGKTVLAAALFVVVYVRLRNSARLYRWLVLAFWVPPAVPLVLGVLYLVSPSTYLTFIEVPATGYTQVSLLSDPHRFQGLSSNPFQILGSSLVAIGFLLPMTIRRLFRRRVAAAAIGFSYIGGLMFMIFWTMTRTGLLVLLFGLGFGCFMALYHLRKDLIRFVATLAGLLLLAALAWSVMPEELVEAYVSRFYSKDVVSDRWQYYTGGRIDIWSYFIEIALVHPQGVGFNFEQKFGLDSPFQEKLNPHSALLIVLMFGGFGGFASVVVLMWAVLRSIRHGVKRYRAEPGFLYYVGAVTGVLGIWISWQGPTMSDFTHAILLAMVLRGTPAMAGISARASLSRAVSTADASNSGLAKA